jgi:ABC-2 type transport system permease protein
MAVYKHAYRPYTGAVTPAWSRFLVLPRYSFETLFRSRFLTSYFVLCFVPAIIAAGIIYLWNTPAARVLLGGPADRVPFSIDGRFFYYILRVQCGMVFLFTAWVGPTLVAPDLANNALPLYLCRPFSRAEYVIGKMSILLILLSFATWVPDLLLYSLQGGLAGDNWFWTHGRVAWAIFMGSALWIAIISLLALAMSAWVKWRIAASALIVGIFFVAAGFGQAFNAVLRTYWGYLLNLSYLIKIVWEDLFDIPAVATVSRRGNIPWQEMDLPVGVAWVALLGLAFTCLLLLNRKLRAKEVVRG